MAKTSTVKIISPTGKPASIRRGQKMAKRIKRKLSASITESLDETMSKMQGRSWTSE